MTRLFTRGCFEIYFVLKIILIRAVLSTDKKSGINDLTKLSWETYCKLQPNGYDCGEKGIESKFYYDIKLGDCSTAEMGLRCIFNINRFESISECHDACRDHGDAPIDPYVGPAVFCRLQPDFGACNDYYPRWYFDVSMRRCRGFSYSGCGGNYNRFSSFQICSATCAPLIDYTPTKINYLVS